MEGEQIKYRIIPEEEVSKEFYIRCEFCGRTPMLKVKGNKAEFINMKCPCNVDKIYPINEYIDKMTKIYGINILKGTEEEKLKERDCEECKTNGKFFCFTCQSKLCEECEKKHHKPIEIQGEEFQTVPSKFKCEICQNDRKSEKYCPTCEKWLCHECLEEHHILVSSDSLDESPVAKYKKKIKCEYQCPNKNDAEEYCCTCEKWICHDCMQSRHNNAIHTMKNKPEILTECSCNQNKVIEFYCRSCCKNLCRGCAFGDIHKFCDKVEISKEFNENLFNTFDEKIKEVEGQIERNLFHYQQFKDYLEKKLKFIKDKFTINDNINKSILMLLKGIQKSYQKEKNSFNMKNTIKEISNFNIRNDQFKEEEKFKKIDEQIKEFTDFLDQQFCLSDKIPNYFYKIEQAIKKDSKKPMGDNCLINTFTLVKANDGSIATCGKKAGENYGKVFIINKTGIVKDKEIQHNKKVQGNVYCICTRPKDPTKTAASFIPMKGQAETEDNNTENDFEDIISCGEDKMISIWGYKPNKNDFSCAKFFQNAHDGVINKVIVIYTGMGTTDCKIERFASCSHDQTIKIWKLYKPYQKDALMTIKVNSAVVSIIQVMNKNILISASLDKKAKFWDISEALPTNDKPVILDTPLSSIDVSCAYQNSIFQVDLNNVIFGCTDGTVKIFNVEDEKKPELVSVIKDNYFNPTGDYKTITGGGVSAFAKLQDETILCGCPNGGLVQLVKNGKKFEIISRKEKIVDHDMVGFTFIEIGEQKFYYCLSISGQIVEFKV